LRWESDADGVGAVTCYLVRHGTAASGPDDRLRSLTPAGRAEVLATARALAAHRVAVAEIRHSGLSRARETAEILGGSLAPPQGIHAATGLAPEDDPAVAAAELELAAQPLMLVGHLPHLARLAAALVGGVALERIAFAPATAVGLRRRPDGWELELVVPPRVGAGA
jgi:phosphohistidine phosphatase